MVEPIRISVALPLYRARAEFVAELLDRLASTESVAEVVATDDDPSHSERHGVAEVIRRSLVPIRYVANSRQLGMTGNWNAAVERASHEWVLLHCQDDLVIPDAFDAFVARLTHAGHPGIGVAAFVNLDGQGRRSGPCRLGNGITAPITERPDSVARGALFAGNVYGFPTSTVFHRSVWSDVGGYRDRYEHAADLDFVLRASRVADGLLVDPDPTTERRVHDANLTLHHVASGATGRDRERLRSDFAHHLRNVDDEQRADAVVIARALNDLVRHVANRRWEQSAESTGQIVRHARHGVWALPGAFRAIRLSRRALRVRVDGPGDQPLGNSSIRARKVAASSS